MEKLGLSNNLVDLLFFFGLLISDSFKLVHVIQDDVILEVFPGLFFFVVVIIIIIIFYLLCVCVL